MEHGIFTFPPNVTGPTMEKSNLTTSDKGDGSNNGTVTAIAAGVTVSAVVVALLILGIAYWYYRKKYPVRMIVGRDFAKFSNPAYSRRPTGQTHTLVREDADTFFQQTQPTGPTTLVLGAGDEEARICYVNTGFQYDSQDADEEEVERRFRQQKAYLFRKDAVMDDEEKADGDEQLDENVKATKDRPSKMNGQIGRDWGHDNAAYADDSEGEDDTKETADTRRKDTTDTGSETSVVSSASNKDRPSHDIPVDALTDTIQHRLAGMTVRDFLQLAAREKRAFSDVRARADSDAARTFVFDITKSARRRAQSAGDIWTSAIESMPSATKVKLMRNMTDATKNAAVDRSEVTQPTDSKHENINENVNFTPKITDSTDGITQSDDVSEVTQAEPVHTEGQLGEEEPVNASSIEESNVFGEDTLSREGNEKLYHSEEEEDYTERARTDSSTNKNRVSSEVESAQTAVHDVGISSSQSQEEEGADSSQGVDTEITASSLEMLTGQEDGEGDYVNINQAFLQSCLPAGTGANIGGERSSRSEPSSDDDNQLVEPCVKNVLESSPVTPAVDDVHTENHKVDGADLLSTCTSISGRMGSDTDTSDIQIIKTFYELSHDKLPSGNDRDDAQNESLSSSVVILDRSELEDQDVQHGDSDKGSFKTSSSSDDEKLSIEDEDFDRVSQDLEDQQTKLNFEQEGVLSLTSVEQSPIRTEQRGSVQILPTLAYSDHSSLSSNEGVEPKKDEPSDSSRLEGKLMVIASQSTTRPASIAWDKEEVSTPLQHTTGSISLEESYLEPAIDEASQLAASSPPETSRLRGLAALRSHPVVLRASESESEEGGMELSVEDIQQVLEGSDDVSDEDHEPQPPPVKASKNPVKIPTEKFVFSDKFDDDIDV